MQPRPAEASSDSDAPAGARVLAFARSRGAFAWCVRVRECVRSLPDEFRSAVVMRDMESLSYEEIAEVLGVPPGTVRSRIHRGRLLLQQMLREFVQ